jgi:hypothetical protein
MELLRLFLPEVVPLDLVFGMRKFQKLSPLLRNTTYIFLKSISILGVKIPLKVG